LDIEDDVWLYVAMLSAALFAWNRVRAYRNRNSLRAAYYQQFILGAACDGGWHDVTTFQAHLHERKPFFQAYWTSLVYEWLVFRDFLEEAGNPVDGDAPFVRITDKGRRRLESISRSPI